MRALLVSLGLVIAACGTSTIGRPCTEAAGTGCHCNTDPAPIKCPGDWICNAQKRCEYTCAPTCEDGGCPTTQYTCSGSLCRSTAALDTLQCP